MDKPLSFKPYKFYLHSGGEAMKTLAHVETHYYGLGIMAEFKDGSYHPVGMDETNAVNWKEISEQEWLEWKESSVRPPSVNGGPDK